MKEKQTDLSISTITKPTWFCLITSITIHKRYFKRETEKETNFARREINRFSTKDAKHTTEEESQLFGISEQLKWGQKKERKVRSKSIEKRAKTAKSKTK